MSTRYMRDKGVILCSNLYTTLSVPGQADDQEHDKN